MSEPIRKSVHQNKRKNGRESLNATGRYSGRSGKAPMIFYNPIIFEEPDNIFNMVI